MAFRVELRPRAEQDLETLFRQLVQVASIRGPEWVNGMERAIASLREMPGRCPVVCQFSKGAVEVRQLLYDFTIESRTVWILHIRHGARRALKPRELFE
jgi:plasmid stabilization system protein ParE